MSKKTILIIEDEAIVGFAMQETLEKRGYHIPEIVGSGDQVVSAVIKTNPDLLLMDIRLNGFLDGIDAARRLKMLRQIPVIFITAYSDETVKARLTELKPAGYLLKPVKEEELFSAIEKALEE